MKSTLHTVHFHFSVQKPLKVLKSHFYFLYRVQIRCLKLYKKSLKKHWLENVNESPLKHVTFGILNCRKNT